MSEPLGGGERRRRATLYRRDAGREALVVALCLDGVLALSAEAARALLARAQAAGAVREDVTTEDVGLLFEQLRAVRLGDDRRSGELQRRYLALVMQALRAPAAGPLPGPPPGWDEIRRRWTVRG